MKYLAGKPIPASVDEIVDPTHTAFLVIDMQNDFCREEGVWPKHGVPIPSIKQTTSNISSVIGVARRSQIKIIYVQNTVLPRHLGDSPGWTRFLMKSFKVDDPEDVPLFTLEGTWGHEIVEELRPEEGDIVVEKHRSSAFVNTDLDFILRNNGIKTLVITGVTTEGCVESTARDGQFYDYMIVTLSDCVDSDSRRNHEAALEIMSGRWDVVPSDQVTKIWLSRSKNVPVQRH